MRVIRSSNRQDFYRLSRVPFTPRTESREANLRLQENLLGKLYFSNLFDIFLIFFILRLLEDLVIRKKEKSKKMKTVCFKY